MKVNAYRVHDHPKVRYVYSKTRARMYQAAGYVVEQDTDKIHPNQENES